jgi:hypothetical protein
MSEATPFTPPNEIVSFAPPPSTTYTPIVDGKLEMFPLSGIIGGVAHRFVFSETGGPGQLKPGRPLAQSMPINIPPNAGWFTAIFLVSDRSVKSLRLHGSTRMRRL